MNTQQQYDHDMIDYDTCYEEKYILTCHDSNNKNRISKDEWLFLVETLDKWHVFNPRAVVKKNPAAAWRCMNLCKDRQVRVPGAYFTACFRTELAKAEFKRELKKRLGGAA